MVMSGLPRKLYAVVVISRDVCRAAVRERMMYGFLLLALLFILMANVPFMVNDPSAFEGQPPEAAALQIGFVAINIFMVLICVFVSLSTLQNFLAKERLIFLLAKPIRRWQIIEGLLLGLFEMAFMNWCLMTCGIWLIVISQTKSSALHIWSGMGVTALLALLYVTLMTFFYVLIPNAVAGVLSIFVLIAGFGASMAQHVLFQRLTHPLLKTGVALGLKALPPINALFGLSMHELGLFDIRVRVLPLLWHTFLIIAALNLLACLKFRGFWRP